MMKQWLNNLRMMSRNDRALIITGAQGSGKSIAAELIVKIMPRGMATLRVTPGDFQTAFLTERLHGNHLVIIEEPPDVLKVLETLKPMITEHRIAVERKGRDKITALNLLNFIILCDEAPDFSKEASDGVRLDRRVLVMPAVQVIAETVGFMP